MLNVKQIHATLRLSSLLFALGLGGCDRIPRDPKSTLDGLRVHGLRVGLLENRPWVMHGGEAPAGVEVEMVRDLAAELHATPHWFWIGADQGMMSLEQYELDLVVGGLTADSPWRTKVGFTWPYFEGRYVVGVSSSEAAPTSLRGRHILTQTGAALSAVLERKGAFPERVPNLAGASGLIAGPQWKLVTLGLTPTPHQLRTESYVWAVPPGENAWIKTLDTYLAKQRSHVEERLRKEEAAQ